MSQDSGLTRKKQPEVVRRALLDQGARLAVEEGLASLTVQAVADAAGVTKGGFLHHFPSKQALIDAVFGELLQDLEREIVERVRVDPQPYGSFTRAYIEAVFDMASEEHGGPWATLSITMLTNAGLRDLWAEWFKAQLERYQATDSDVHLTIARLAADGVWLADLGNVPIPEREQVRRVLLKQTYKTP